MDRMRLTVSMHEADKTISQYLDRTPVLECRNTSATHVGWQRQIAGRACLSAASPSSGSFVHQMHPLVKWLVGAAPPSTKRLGVAVSAENDEKNRSRAVSERS